MADETATSPVEGEDTVSIIDPTLGPDAGVEQQDEEQEFDEDGIPIEREAEDEEIELDDLKLKVPKDQAQKVREGFLRQADYTRKTQEVAELRKAVEAERASVYHASAEEIGARAQLVAIDQQLAQFQNVDWRALEDTDPFGAQTAWREYQQLKDARGQAAGQVMQLTQQRTIAQQQETARLIEQGRAVLARDIKGWDDALAASLLETGVKQYGFDRAEIEEFTDPRMVKVLHDAHQFHQLQRKQQQAQKHEAAQTAKPAARVGGGSAPPAGLDDRLSPDEWMRRRDKQVRQKRA